MDSSNRVATGSTPCTHHLPCPLLGGRRTGEAIWISRFDALNVMKHDTLSKMRTGSTAISVDTNSQTKPLNGKTNWRYPSPTKVVSNAFCSMTTDLQMGENF